VTGRKVVLARRKRLVERADRERADLARQLGEWQKPLRAIDRSVSILRGLWSSPLLRAVTIAGVAALAITRPRRVMGWVGGGRAIWRLVNSVRRV
jgi:hypothetical protein